MDVESIRVTREIGLEAMLRVPRRSDAFQSVVVHVQSRTTVLEENAVQAQQNPENHRFAVDCTWTNASAAELTPPLTRLWSELDTEHSFSIWYGWAPTRGLPDMAFSVLGGAGGIGWPGAPTLAIDQALLLCGSSLLTVRVR